MTLVLACVVCAVFCVALACVCIAAITAVRDTNRDAQVVLREWMGQLADQSTAAVSNTAEAIGKAVQTAQFAPPNPAPTVDELTRVIEQQLEKVDSFDMTDPTDKVDWLRGPRPDVAMVDPNDDEPYGIPGLKNMHKITAPPHGGS